MSNQWKIPPSELLGITDPLAGYYFNRGVLYFGLSMDADIEDSVENAKNKASAERAAKVVRDRWLNDEDEEDTPQARERPAGYRDPAEVFEEIRRRREGG